MLPGKAKENIKREQNNNNTHTRTHVGSVGVGVGVVGGASGSSMVFVLL